MTDPKIIMQQSLSLFFFRANRVLVEKRVKRERRAKRSEVLTLVKPIQKRLNSSLYTAEPHLYCTIVYFHMYCTSSCLSECDGDRFSYILTSVHHCFSQGEIGPSGKMGSEGVLGPLGNRGPRGLTVQGKVVGRL